MTNKNIERFATLSLQMPSGIAISSGELLLLGRGSRVMAGVAATAQVASGTVPAYDSGSGYVTVDFEGAFNLTVSATTQKSPSAGAQIVPGDAVFADGGVYDINTGITYGSSLDVDTNGTFVGIALDGVAAGVTATIRVLLKNSPCN